MISIDILVPSKLNTKEVYCFTPTSMIPTNALRKSSTMLYYSFASPQGNPFVIVVLLYIYYPNINGYSSITTLCRHLNVLV